MPVQGQCPNCRHHIDRCDLEKIVIGDLTKGPILHGISACCPACKTVLGVCADPDVLTTSIVREVVRRVRQRKQ